MFIDSFINDSLWAYREANSAQESANVKRLEYAKSIAEKVINYYWISEKLSKHPLNKIPINLLLILGLKVKLLFRKPHLLKIKISVNDLYNQLERHYNNWQQLITRADNLAEEADQYLNNDNDNPWETDFLEKASSLYRKSLDINYNQNRVKTYDLCNNKLLNKKNFQRFYQQGEQQIKAYYYKRALKKFEKAQSLFEPPELIEQISTCYQKQAEEQEYEKAYKKAKQLTEQGDFQSAIAYLKPAYTSFPREDGKQFLNKLQNVIEAKEAYQEGLMAEKQENWQQAQQYYSQARQQLPDLNETCSTRLALIAIKTQQWSTAFEELNYLPEEKANYLRGYIYAHQGKYQAAHRQWKSLSHPHIQAELEKLKVLVRREKLTLMQQIESALDQETLEQAKTLSQKFLQEYGTDPTIEHNLYQHIQPRITNSAWENQTWQELTKYTENQFVKQQNLSSLHNWAVATYYQAQTNPETMEDWITAWCAAIANLRQDPALKDIPWLGSEEINFDQLLKDLQKLLEDAIDEFKETNLEWYFNLRDKYRKDLVALDNCFTINGLNITPNCYQRHQDKFQEIKFPATVYGALYTAWGEAVAACLKGDIKRTFTITPSFTSDNLAEKYGRIYVAYKQGTYYLQDHNWQSAKSPLNLAKETIRNNSEWQEEIDRLCENIRREINYEEALEFAQFWYDLLNSNTSRSYYVEIRAEKIQGKLADEKLSLDRGKKELEELRKIDKNNVTVLDLLKKINQIEEAQEIDRLLKNRDLEGAVRKARSSQDEKIRYDVASICIEILLDGAEKNSLYREEMIDLARWAYSLCPNEPNFQEVYRQLGFR